MPYQGGPFVSRTATTLPTVRGADPPGSEKEASDAAPQAVATPAKGSMPDGINSPAWIGLAGCGHGVRLGNHADPPGDGARHLAHRLPGTGVIGVGVLRRGDRNAGISTRSDAGLEGDSAQHVQLELARSLRA